jgi:ribonuclease BN (tRNA processing enzyme)
MRLTVVGCSPAWPNPGGAQSGYLVESDGGSVLLDCGPGVLARLRGGETSRDPDAIVITHFHLDHWGDLIPWVWRGLNLTGRGATVRRPALWLPPGGRELLERFGSLLGFPDMFERVFETAEYTSGVPFAAGGCTIIAFRVPHYSVGSHALRVEGDGRVLAYSGDCGPAEALVSAADGADLFLCEATLLSGEEEGEPRGHLSLDEARAAFAASGAKELLITHRPAELDAPGDVELAYDGLVRTV